MIRYVATNLTDLHKEPSFLSELLTQVTNGVKLEVLREHDDKWCYVRQTDGYEGFAYTPFLTDEAPPEPTHIVIKPEVAVFASPDISSKLTRLLAGTRVRMVNEISGWQRVQFVGGAFCDGWLFRSSVKREEMDRLRPLDQFPLPTATARDQIIKDAHKFLGVYYLWGGCSGWGIDCSGLAQLCHRLSGYEIPRDCSLQYPVGRSIEPPFQKGDLLYFWNEARTKVGHVGISLGEDWKIIHSSRKNNGVYEEDVQTNPKLRDFFAEARSFLP